jgi:putrescine transport system ATP-binding protein
VAEMLKLVRLEEFAKRKPHQLSGGQRQRVALARSLAKKPKVLLLDEPLGALDRKLREDTQFELMDLQSELGMTFLIVTHDQEEAMTVADRIAVMDKGRIVQIATPAEIYEVPNSRFVADFIGDINMMECKVVSRTEDGTRLHCPLFSCDIDVAQKVEAGDGETVWFAIRPEKVRISFDEPQDKVNAVHGEVWDIAYLGDVSIYHTHIADEETVRATVANRSRTVEKPVGWDDKVWLSWDRDAGLVLTR